MPELPMADQPEERAERCETCRFYFLQLVLDDHGKWGIMSCPPEERVTPREYEEEGHDGYAGFCRRYPPSGENGQPNVKLDEWCGEWQARKPQEGGA